MGEMGLETGTATLSQGCDRKLDIKESQERLNRADC